MDEFCSFRYECTKGRRKRSILTLLKLKQSFLKLLVGNEKKKKKEKEEKKKKCEVVPVRYCPTVAKVKKVVKCGHH